MKMLSVPFERDFQEITKINSQQEKQFLPIAKISSRKTKKIAISAKLNSRKNLVPRGNHLIQSSVENMTKLIAGNM